MKTIKFSLVITAAALFVLGLSSAAVAFHDDGVAYCAGCHTMHNSQDGDNVSDTPGSHLLIRSDPSSACLRCHAGYGQMTGDGSGYGSGGDFYWLTKTFQWEAHGRTRYSYGRSHGHNIIALDYDLPNPDPVLTTAPGGSFDSSELACSSCHDPHGTGDGALLLWGSEKSNFSADAPILAGLSRRTVIGESGAVADDNHVAYGSGVSDWCANCHGDFLSGDEMHPVNQQLGSTMAAHYNDYVSTDNPNGGDALTSYWEIVPFETGLPLDQLDTSSTAGPTSSSKAMCLSCHRAHATAFPDSGKWDFSATLIIYESHPQIGDIGATADDVTNSYYGRVFDDGTGEHGTTQRSLCNKCHGQD
jgi:hypothetical protein